ncbi:low affinity iron permease family protein [Mesorhizobium koreense]|uniref:low affinity iron permease family protein n=1 Tax=Mesorhizobium koreense TaxID=3074855 RepID=UPI00287BA691|nr:low affinity iron permease family protein [Mesorhizobium sp. WR6]
MSFNRAFSTTANAVAHAAGMPVTFLACCAIVVVWAVSGPVFGFSDTWQLIINTGTTIITFLMVFLIQNTQNRDGAAIQAKLDELIRAGHGENTFIGIEHLTEEEVAEFRERCEKAAKEHGRDVEVEMKLKAEMTEKEKAAKPAPSKKSAPTKKKAKARAT